MSFLRYLEEEIVRYDKRVQKILANPDPTKPKSNYLMYELERDNRISNIEAYKAGKPFATGLYPPTIFKALGLEVWDGVMASDRTGGEPAKRYFEAVQRGGLPYQVCDRTVISIPMVISGDCPKPALVVSTNWECENIPLCHNFIGKYYDLPTYYLDVPLETSERTLEYVADQFAELIEFAERYVPGAKYDEDKLIEMQTWELRWNKAYRDIYQLRKRTPCPLAGKEAFREPRWPTLYHDPSRAVKYIETYRDDLYEMADKGILPVKEEKLRLMWCISGPFYDDPFKYLESRGVSVPWWQIGNMSRVSGVGSTGIYGEEKEYGRKLSLLEEEARIVNQSAWGGLGKRWIDDALFVCEDLHLDGIVYFLQWGCTVTVGVGKILAEAAEQELNIPTLLLEGRMLDQEVYDAKKFREQLDEFLDICLENKKKLARKKANELVDKI